MGRGGIRVCRVLDVGSVILLRVDRFSVPEMAFVVFRGVDV